MTPRTVTPTKAAVIAVILQAGKVLVIQRGGGAPRAGYWMPPGGKVNHNERQEAAVVREVQEETGLVVRPLRLVWECRADGVDYHLYWWLAEPVGGALQLNTEEVADAQWINPAEFALLQPTFPQGREFFQRVISTLPECKSLSR